MASKEDMIVAASVYVILNFNVIKSRKNGFIRISFEHIELYLFILRQLRTF